MFQFPGFPAYAYLIQYMLRDSSSRGFPHSEICGSKLICSSPQLIAACHVLRRLPMPRHSPYALLRLNYLQQFDLLPWFSLFARIAVSIHLQCFWQNCFFYPTEKPDFLRVSPLSFMFPLLCLSCMSHSFFRINMIFSYSVFNEHSPLLGFMNP